jgi:hypothetical protein
MKLTIAVASNSYPDDDLSTLRANQTSGVPKFDTSDNMHYNGGRNVNNNGQGILKPTISKAKKKAAKKKRKYKRDQDALKLEIEKQRAPKENPAVTDRATSSTTAWAKQLPYSNTRVTE